MGRPFHTPGARRALALLLMGLAPASAGSATRGAAALAAAEVPGSDDAGRAPRIVFHRGVLYLWDHTAPELAPFPQGLLPGDAAATAVVDPADGRGVVIVRGPASAAGRGRNGDVSEAHLLAWSPGARDAHGLTLAWSARFEGLPRAAAAAASRTWILARNAGGETGPGLFFVYELDRTAGRLEGRTVLPAPAFALASDLLGRRLFAALDDRILSLTTRPLVPSWHYRSPGPNRALAVSPAGTVLASARGREVALFDAAAIAARSTAGAGGRTDDATTVVALPFVPEELVFSRDGALVAALGGGSLVFVVVSSGAVIWPETAAPLAGATAVQALSFPATGRDLVVAAFPSGAVAALPAPAVVGSPAPQPVAESPAPAEPAPPAVPAPSAAPEKPAAAATTGTPPPGDTAADAAPAPARASTPAPSPEPVPDEEAAPPPAPEPAGQPAPATAPPDRTPTQDAPAQEPATLSGTVSGDRARARAVVLFGPNSIIREFARVTPDASGAWKAPLPPPGVYRIVAIGDGSTPIPVAPGFITVTVAAGESRRGLDFVVGAAP